MKPLAVDSPKIITSAEHTEPLPLNFADIHNETAPTEKTTEPFPCISAFFTPARDLPDLKEDGGMRLTLNDVVIDAERMTLTDIWGMNIAPYQIIEYTIKDPYGDCRTGAIEVLKDGKHLALYTHLYAGESGGLHWSINPVTETLVVHNRHIKNSTWVEENRVIDLKTKSERALRLDPCYINARVRDDGTMYGGYGDMRNDGVDEGAPIYCEMDADGTLLMKMNPMGVGGSTIPFMHFDSKKHLVAFIDLNAAITHLMPNDHPIVVVNTDNPSQWVAFNYQIPENCCGQYEFDLSEFTFEQPKMRYRHTDQIAPGSDEMQTSEWISLP